MLRSWLSFGFNPLALDTVLALTRETDSIPRLQYFLTQVNVLWQYLGLLWWPLDLHLDRHVVPVTGFNSVTILALAAHIALITFAIWAGRRWPLLSFGILFYYLAHIVESSFLPIKDLMFEHRTYLPNVGAFLLLAWGFLALAAAIARASARGELDKCPGGARSVRRGWLAFGVVAFVTLAVLSWQRNQMWRDAVSFWNHNAQLTPQKDRPWGILGKQLIRAGRYEDALRALQYAIALKQNQTGSLNPLDLINLVVALRQLGRDDEALAIIDQVLRNPLPALLRSKLLINKGNIYYVRKQTDTAQKLYSQALQANPDSLEARANLGNVMIVQGKLAQAEQLYRQILEIDPDNSQYRENYTMIRQALDKQK